MSDICLSFFPLWMLEGCIKKEIMDIVLLRLAHSCLDLPCCVCVFLFVENVKGIVFFVFAHEDEDHGVMGRGYGDFFFF